MASIQDLRNALPNLSDKDRSFAESLLAGWERFGHLTARQAPWADKLIERAANGGAEPPRKTTAVGDLSGVLALFDRAARKLKHPAIVLHVANVGTVRINVAGEKARVPGSLNVATDEKFRDATWYGRILRNGNFEASPRVATPDALVPALERFAASPAEVAAEHGRLTGRCCFCDLPLKDERSTAVGYGKTCAANYGLPWGAKAAAPLLTCEAAI